VLGAQARNQIKEEDFWAAAQRLRPVELQLEELHVTGNGEWSPLGRGSSTIYIYISLSEYVGLFFGNIIIIGIY
jgi:hypothetical protein